MVSADEIPQRCCFHFLCTVTLLLQSFSFPHEYFSQSIDFVVCQCLMYYRHIRSSCPTQAYLIPSKKLPRNKTTLQSICADIGLCILHGVGLGNPVFGDEFIFGSVTTQMGHCVAVLCGRVIRTDSWGGIFERKIWCLIVNCWMYEVA